MRIPALRVLLIILLAQSLQAQQDTTYPGYSVVFLARDIPDRRITGVAQDSDGFLWISTFNGLFRYDGIRYKAFRNQPDAEHKISFHTIGMLRLMMDRYLVIGGERTLNILDTKTEELIYQSTPEEIYTKSIVADSQLYFYFEDSLFNTYLYRFTDGQLVPLKNFIPPGVRVERICATRLGIFYFLDKTGRLWTADSHSGESHLLDSITFTGRKLLALPFLHSDSEQRLWIFDNANSRYDSYYRLSDNQTLELAGHITSRITLLQTEKTGVFWHYNIDSHILSTWNLATNATEEIVQLPAYINNVISVLRDDDGNLWSVIRDGTGIRLLYIHFHLSAFQTILSEKGRETALGQSIRALTELSDGRLLIGSADGIHAWDPVTKKEMRLKVTMDDPDLSVSNIWSIIPGEGDSTLWFTKEEGGVLEYSFTSQKAKNYMPGPDVNDRFLGMQMDDKKVLWIGTRSSVAWFDTRTRSYDKGKKIPKELLEVSNYNWIPNDDGTWWLCGAYGLIKFDAEGRWLRRYGTDTEPHLLTNQVFDVVQSGDTYWIATDHGLHKLHGDTISVFTVDHGIANDAVASLLMDDGGYLWLGTFGGLSRMNIHTGEIVNFYVEDGLPHNEFNRLSRLAARSGKLFFGTLNGVVHFNPAEIIKRQQKHSLVLTDFYTFGKDGEVVKKDVKGMRDPGTPIVIPAGNKYFQVEFALLNFIHPEDNRYSYYLEGLEDGWRPLTNIPLIQYNNLPAGKYTLHIRGVSPSGQGSSNDLDLDITVMEHFYSTLPFFILVGLVLGVFIFVVVRSNVQNKIRMEQLRNKISTDLHDEVGGVLSGVAMQMDLLETRSPDHLRPYMHRVAESSRNAALKMRDVIWSVDSSKDHFQDLLDRMKAYTLELLAPVDINYKFDIQGIDLQKTLDVELRQNVYLIFKEAMNNILRHAAAKNVEIRLTGQRNQLCMQICDDGVGMPEIIMSRGQGLANMKKRAQKIGGILEISKGKSGGTEIKLIVSWK